MTTVPGLDGRLRCAWAAGSAAMEAYHDTEWGFPVADDRRLFEKLCLEAFQSGLSWRTILDKRESLRRAFAGFDMARVAAYGPADVARLLGDASIVRNRAKIEAVIANAATALRIIAGAGSLAGLLWCFEPGPAEIPVPASVSVSRSSVALARELKRQGWRFVGPTTAFAFMQSVGMINDHVPGCVIREEVDRARAAFRRPR